MERFHGGSPAWLWENPTEMDQMDGIHFMEDATKMDEARGVAPFFWKPQKKKVNIKTFQHLQHLQHSVV